MDFFCKKETKLFLNKYYRLNFKKGVLEKMETKTLKISYLFWRKKKISFLYCLSKILKNASLSINFKKIKLKGTSAKIPFFVHYKKRFSTVLRWIYAHSGRKKFFSSFETFFFENLKKKDEVKSRKKVIYEVANQHKVFASKRWF